MVTVVDALALPTAAIGNVEVRVLAAEPKPGVSVPRKTFEVCGRICGACVLGVDEEKG